jgi:amidase
MTKQHIPKEKHRFSFSKSDEPAIVVSPGDEIVFETLDSWAGDLERPEDIASVYHPIERANPATGPVFVRGAIPGDTLVVDILAITLLAPIISKIVPRGGLLAGEVTSPYCRFLSMEHGWLSFPGGIRLPIRPMIGVIGTAPAGNPMPNLWPGGHGGNMDHNDVRIGARVYLPVAVPGALLAIGDVHASMGDAEASGAGLDCPSEVTARVTIARGLRWPRPFIETQEAWITCASAASLQEAVRIATRDMVDFLSTRLHISREDAFLLASAAGDVRIGQADGGLIDSTARMRFPKVDGLGLGDSITGH